MCLNMPVCCLWLLVSHDLNLWYLVSVLHNLVLLNDLVLLFLGCVSVGTVYMCTKGLPGVGLSNKKFAPPEVKYVHCYANEEKFQILI